MLGAVPARVFPGAVIAAVLDARGDRLRALRRVQHVLPSVTDETSRGRAERDRDKAECT